MAHTQGHFSSYLRFDGVLTWSPSNVKRRMDVQPLREDDTILNDIDAS